MSIATKCTCGMSPSSFCLSGVKECKQFPKETEKKCNCNQPYDAEYFQGGHPYCPIHDVRQTSADAQDQIIANQVAGMPLEEAIFQAGYSAGVEFERGRKANG